MGKQVKIALNIDNRSVELSVNNYRGFLADWFMRLSKDGENPVHQRSRSSTNITLTCQNGLHVVAHFTDDAPFLRFEAMDAAAQPVIDAIAAKALDQVSRGNLGGTVWYSTTLTEPARNFPSHSTRSYAMALVADRTVINGWRRLNDVALLEFKDEVFQHQDQGALNEGKRTLINVHVAVPGPCAGDFSNTYAVYCFELVEAICTLALGRQMNLPPHCYPTLDEDVPTLNSMRYDESILGLARRSISLDVFVELPLLGGLDCARRVNVALKTFSAAMRQERDPVACMLYVIAAEALTTPFTSWKQDKLTKRFRHFFEDMMPDVLDHVTTHPSFEEAFGIKRGKRQASTIRRNLLEKIYGIRSALVHEGLWSSYGFITFEDFRGEVTRTVLAYFAEMAILRFMASPRESCVGHPGLEMAAAGQAA